MEKRRKQLDKASYLSCVLRCAPALSGVLKGGTLNSCSRLCLLFFPPPLSRCSCRKRLREKQIRFTSRLICALIWYVQSVYSNCDTKFEYLASPRLTTAASKHSKSGCRADKPARTHTHTSLCLSHIHTHTRIT